MIELSIQINAQSAMDVIDGVSDRARDLSPAMRECFQILRTSILRNFEVGGRKARWKRSHRAASEGGKTLVDTGGLRDSIAGSHPSIGRHSMRFGTNKVYAAVHQFGAAKGSFGTARSKPRTGVGGPMKRFSSRQGLHPIPWGTIPARPFMVVQPEDLKAMKEAILDYVRG